MVYSFTNGAKASTNVFRAHAGEVDGDLSLVAAALGGEHHAFAEGVVAYAVAGAEAAAEAVARAPPAARMMAASGDWVISASSQLMAAGRGARPAALGALDQMVGDILEEARDIVVAGDAEEGAALRQRAEELNLARG